MFVCVRCGSCCVDRDIHYSGVTWLCHQQVEAISGVAEMGKVVEEMTAAAMGGGGGGDANGAAAPMATD